MQVIFFQDASFEFEKKRNVPVMYQREVWDKTGLWCFLKQFLNELPFIYSFIISIYIIFFILVNAIKRIEEIKNKRQNQFIKNR